VVVDAAGRPVAGAKVGTAFRLASSFAKTQTIIGWGQPAVVSDVAGAFSIPAAPIRYTRVLVAAGSDGSMGFIVRGPSAPLEIRLAKPVQLDLEVVKTFGSRRPIAFDLMAGGSALGYGEAAMGITAFVVPAGSVELHAHDAESIANVTKLSLDAHEATHLKLELQPTAWARNVGKPAPGFTPTDLQNTRPGESLEALRGKWVLVDFWAKWCVPCIEEMPKFISFYEKHAAKHDQFDIVGVHSPDGASLAAIRSDYDSLVKRGWSGKQLPFPLVFDSTGNTQKRWGIEVYPTTLLVDPEGRIVGLGTLDDLARALGE
jgi:thiol-disulfide isomerase/thioredoxin